MKGTRQDHASRSRSGCPHAGQTALAGFANIADSVSTVDATTELDALTFWASWDHLNQYSAVDSHCVLAAIGQGWWPFTVLNLNTDSSDELLGVAESERPTHQPGLGLVGGPKSPLSSDWILADPNHPLARKEQRMSQKCNCPDRPAEVRNALPPGADLVPDAGGIVG